MQPVRIWSSNCDNLISPQHGHELGFSCILSSKKAARRMILGLNAPVYHSNRRSISNLLVATSTYALRFRILMFSDSNRGSVSVPATLACTIVSELGKDGSNPVNGLLLGKDGRNPVNGLLLGKSDNGIGGDSFGLNEEEASSFDKNGENENLVEGNDDFGGNSFGLNEEEDSSFSKNGENENLAKGNEDFGGNSFGLNEVEASSCDKSGENENLVKGNEDFGGDKGKRVDVRALAKSLHFAETTDDVEEILNRYGELPLQVYSSIIKSFGIEKRLSSAMILVEWLKVKREESCGAFGPNLFVYNSLLGAVKQSRKYELVEKVMIDMVDIGINPNVVTYNTLMSVYLEQDRANEALGILDEIKQKGLSPSPVSYSTALLAYRKLEDGFGALNFLVELRQKFKNGELGKDGNRENWENEFSKLEKLTIVVCFQVMRRWLVKGGVLIIDVLTLLKSMDGVRLQPHREELERLVWACTDEEHYVVAKELYSRIRENHSEITLSVSNHLIWLMGKSRKWWAALEVYEDMLEKGPKPNNLSYELILSHFNILLSAASKRGIWRWGVRLLDKMQEKGIKPRTQEWNAVLIACSKASEASTAVKIFTRMIEHGEKPTIVSYGALLSALEKGKLYEDAIKVWNHMVKVGVQPNLYAYTIMASICIGQGKFNLVDSVIRDMKAAKIDPTVVTYNAIISACAKNGLGGVAYEWFLRMKVEDVFPNEITYEMLIEALANDVKPRLAFEMYLRARNEGLSLASKAYDAVMESSKAHGAAIDLYVLGHRPIDVLRGPKPDSQVRKVE